MKLPKKYKPLANNRGFTKVGLIVVIAAIILIGAVGVVLLPQLAKANQKAKVREQDAACWKNHKLIALSLSMFANDHDGKLPWQVSEKDGGSMEYFSPRSDKNALLDASGEPIFDENAWRHFLPLGPSLGNNFRILICPTSKKNGKANLPTSSDEVSYWLLTDEKLNFDNAKYPSDAFFSVCPHHPDKSYIASTADGGAMSVSWPKMRQQIIMGRELKAEQK